MEAVPPKPVRVLVCGERMREDNGVADVAVARLPAEVLALAHVEHVGVLSVESLLDVPEGCAVVVTDSAAGVAAGVVVSMPLDEIDRNGVFPSTTHVTPPDEIVAAAGALSGRPIEGLFVGMGGAEFGFGETLSPAVAATLPDLVRALGVAIRSLAGSPGGD